MGKPYDKHYLLAGSYQSVGDMVCAYCRKPIDIKKHDWMHWKKSKSYDWSYFYAHRKCCDDQSQWQKIERNISSATQKADIFKKDVIELMRKHKINENMDFIYDVATSLDVDLDDYFFGVYGSC